METPKIKNVLDYGSVRLVDSMGSDISVVRAARVSYNAAWRAGADTGSDTRLINYLWKNRHTTPFEAVQFTFEIEAPIFVLRQWHRHRTWSYNEVSARYTELPAQYYLPKAAHVTTQSQDNKQSRTKEQNREAWNILQDMEQTNRRAVDAYRKLLSLGCPRELARTVLPLATYSRMFASVNLLNLLKFLDLRLHDHAQYEIRVYAEAMRDLIKPVVPVCVEAWENNRNQERLEK